MVIVISWQETRNMGDCVLASKRNWKADITSCTNYHLQFSYICKIKVPGPRKKPTLLNWILFVSNIVCAIPGTSCLSRTSRLSALFANNPLLSISPTRSFIFPHELLALNFSLGVTCVVFVWPLRRHRSTADSSRFANSSILCSSAMSSSETSRSGEKCSEAIAR